MSADESLVQSTDSLEAGGYLKDDMEEVEVSVTDAKQSKVTTIVQMVTTMIDATKSFYQRLYDIKVDEQIKLVFKFVRSVAGLQEEGAVLEGVIEIKCKHEHPVTLPKMCDWQRNPTWRQPFSKVRMCYLWSEKGLKINHLTSFSSPFH